MRMHMAVKTTSGERHCGETHDATEEDLRVLESLLHDALKARSAYLSLEKENGDKTYFPLHAIEHVTIVNEDRA